MKQEKENTPRNMSKFVKGNTCETKARFDDESMSKSKVMTVEGLDVIITMSVVYDEVGMKKPQDEIAKRFASDALNGLLQHTVSGMIRSGSINQSLVTMDMLKPARQEKAKVISPEIIAMAEKVLAAALAQNPKITKLAKQLDVPVPTDKESSLVFVYARLEAEEF
jgi:hypothetical protein